MHSTAMANEENQVKRLILKTICVVIDLLMYNPSLPLSGGIENVAFEFEIFFIHE